MLNDGLIQTRGFTLLETVVVLLLVTLVSGLVLPSFVRSLGTILDEGDLREVVIELSGLSYKAYSNRQGIRLESPSDVSEMIEAAVDWRIEVIGPVIVKANGICQGGELRFERGEFSRLVRLAAPFCEPQVSPYAGR